MSFKSLSVSSTSTALKVVLEADNNLELIYNLYFK